MNTQETFFHLIDEIRGEQFRDVINVIKRMSQNGKVGLYFGNGISPRPHAQSYPRRDAANTRIYH